MKQILKIRHSLLLPLVFIALLVITHLFAPNECYGIIPRYESGLRGILLAPLLHGSWNHLFSNSFPLLVLGFMLLEFYKKQAYLLLIIGWLGTGALVWIFADLGWFFGENIGCHIGASGVVYVLAAFLFFSGIFSKSIQLMAISLIVVFLYGSMIWGVIPQELLPLKEDAQKISWESHLAGAVVGTFMAYFWRKKNKSEKKWSWQKNTYNAQYDEELWQRYLEKFPEEEEENPTDTQEEKPKFHDLF